MTQLKHLFEPAEVIIVGSSKIREKVGMVSPQLFKNVIYNMRNFFHGRTHIIDLAKNTDCHKLDELPRIPELAVMTLPPRQSVRQAEVCAKAGVKALVMIAGGYTPQQRQKLLDIQKASGIGILGPNSIMGVINTANGLNTTFERDVMPEKGNIAVISQSGGIGADLLDWAYFYRIGMSKFAFVGDKIDIDDIDLLRYLDGDRNTRVICLYMEGIKNGRRFIKEARKIVRKKPILALKGGTTVESAKRAKSHTAAIAGSDEIFDAAFKKAGIIRVKNIEELMNGAIALSKQPPMQGDNVLIVSNVGGPAILASDAVIRNNMRLVSLSRKTKQDIENLYPGIDAANPLDLIADARAERYSKVLQLVLDDEGVHGVVVINMLKSCFFEAKDAEAIQEIAVRYPEKTFVDVTASGEDFELVYKVLRKTKIPLYSSSEKAVNALKILRSYGRIIEKH